eukprot:Phypoly_transcript_19184.p2 GENE.Phypoly_transcript_19184~~Phypoly_transcript_19184.p2  ORF type:complete len:122 (+),score=29.21 Phypoly_transcript_19184:136-501(+)
MLTMTKSTPFLTILTQVKAILQSIHDLEQLGLSKDPNAEEVGEKVWEKIEQVLNKTKGIEEENLGLRKEVAELRKRVFRQEERAEVAEEAHRKAIILVENNKCRKEANKATRECLAVIKYM